MKSKFFVVAAIFALALVIGGMTKAYAELDPDLEGVLEGDHITLDDIHVSDSSDFTYEGISDDAILDAVHPEFDEIRRALSPSEFRYILSITDSDDDGIKDLYDNCPVDANELQEDFDEDGRGDVCDDSDDDGLFDDEDACPDVFADTVDGCPVEEDDGGLIIGGGYVDTPVDDTNVDLDDGSQAVEGMGGACSLVQNAGVSNALPLIVLALSLVPITIRRSKISK